jgi:hypothetical protein
MEQKVELAKLRDFGEVISDTFQFIRQNLKPLLKSYFIFCGFFLIATAAITFVQQYKMMNVYNEINSSGPRTFASSFSAMWVSIAALVLFYFLTICAITTTTLCFIALYKEKGNIAPDTDEIWVYFKYYYLRIFGSTIVVGILLVAGFVLCLVPGLYLFPILSLVPPIIVMENSGFGNAFNRSFQLIKENWWVTFGTILVVGIIVNVLSTIVTLPASAVNLTTMWLRPQKMPNLSVGSIILSVILQYIALVLLIIPNIAVSLCYFNLAEHKEGTSLLDRINKFGTPGEQTNLPTEEY